LAVSPIKLPVLVNLIFSKFEFSFIYLYLFFPFFKIKLEKSNIFYLYFKDFMDVDLLTSQFSLALRGFRLLLGVIEIL